MSAEFTEKILVEAFCKTVACTGYGAFEDSEKEHFEENVLTTVPENMHEDYPDNLLLCSINICEKEPYSWEVDNTPPIITNETTFGDLFDDWFKSILSEA